MAAADLEYWFSSQNEFCFYGSSLLFAYDSALAEPVLRVRMIDFAHAHSCSDGGGRQDGSYLDG